MASLNSGTAGGSRKRRIDNLYAFVNPLFSGDASWPTDGTFDIGTTSNGNKRPRHINISGTVTAGAISFPAGSIARADIANGTINQVVINSGTGALSSEAQLANTRGGTGRDTSADSGIPHIVTGNWSTSAIVTGDITNATITGNKMASPLTSVNLDTSCRIEDSVDNTKKLALDLTAITTGNTRTKKVQNTSATTNTIAELEATQSFTGINTFSQALQLSSLSASQVVATDVSKNTTSLAYSSTPGATLLVQSDGSGFIGSWPIRITSAGTTFVDNADTTKVINFDAHLSTTGTKLTVRSNQSTSQSIDMPNVASGDSLMTLNTTQSPVSKTFNSTSTFTGVRCASITPDGTNTLTFPAVTGTAYSTGVGSSAAVTQLTSNNVNVTLNQPMGQITMHATINSGTTNTFTLNNSFITATSTILVSCDNTLSATSFIKPTVTATAAGTGNVTITVVNNDATHATSAAPIIGFWVT